MSNGYRSSDERRPGAIDLRRVGRKLAYRVDDVERGEGQALEAGDVGQRRGWTLRWDRMTEELVWYVPITLSELPAWVAIHRNEQGTPTGVIDTREEDQ